MQVTIPEELLQVSDKMEHQAEEEVMPKETGSLGTKALFTHPDMAKAMWIMFINWIVTTLGKTSKRNLFQKGPICDRFVSGYYGISMSATGLSDDPAVAFILSAIVEVPSYFVAAYLIDYWGRKPLTAFSLLLAGVTCIPAGFASGTLQLILVLIGKFGASAAFSLIYVYTAELFPTEVRSTALGLCSMMARIGGVAAPQVSKHCTYTYLLS